MPKIIPKNNPSRTLSRDVKTTVKNSIPTIVFARVNNVSLMDGTKYELFTKRKRISHIRSTVIVGKKYFKDLFLSSFILFLVVEIIVRKLSTYQRCSDSIIKIN